MRIKILALPLAAAFALSATLAMAQTSKEPAKPAGDKMMMEKKKKGKAKAMAPGGETLMNKGAGGGATTSSKDSPKPAGK